MIGSILKKFSGNHYRKFYKRAQPIVEKINQLEQSYQSLTDEQLQAKTPELMARFQEAWKAGVAALGGDDANPEKLVELNKNILDDLLPEAFAVAKNGARRLCDREIEYTGTKDVWRMVHYDVQLIGGMALHDNKIAEMATGEGKTLVSTLPLYLNALSGRNCQLVTVNEYLASRDAEWMGALFKFLGLTVGVLRNQQPNDEKRAAYECNLTYGTASEFGFDYLRDNGMASTKEQQVQKDHYFCIVDEIDSILIDEARTPLIISGPIAEDREAPFEEHKPGILKLVSAQVKMCEQLVREAKEELEKEDGDDAAANEKLLQVKLGMPKNREFMRLMEKGNIRMSFEKYDLEMHSDFNKAQLFTLKEHLYYTIDEKQHQADLTEVGRSTLRPGDPDAFVMPDLPTEFIEIDRDEDLDDAAKMKAKQEAEANFAQQSEDLHCISQLLRAYSLYERDRQYVVSEEGKVVIIDENTGRPMPGRRWSEGLHQAVEAKENVKIEKESKTYATITIQNYFRLYEKLAGMTGTAETEVQEFHDIYNLDVTVIPTNKPCLRIDENDVIYKTEREKFAAVVESVAVAHERGQPVLLGTASVIASEEIGKLLKRRKIPHAVLNAKYHQQEAEIVANAGQRGAVTVATNMAGRGTDIKLGEGVRELGGLLVLGTERHESRRIDRQLRGRCARQGDPGMTKFYVSLEDDLMRLFANAGPISKILQNTFNEGEVLEHPLLNRSIESAQKKVEQQHYSVRKRLLQFDEVLNRQREVVYGIRNDALHTDIPREIIFEMIEEELEERWEAIAPAGKDPTNEDLENLLSWLNSHFPVSLKSEDLANKDSAAIVPHLMEQVNKVYTEKESLEDPERIIGLQRTLITVSIDNNWQDHLTEIEDLRRSIYLRGHAQKDPLMEFKAEAFTFFTEMMGRVRNELCRRLFRSSTSLEAHVRSQQMMQQKAQLTGPDEGAVAQGQGVGSGGLSVASGQQAKLPKVVKKAPPVVNLPKIGRNDTVTIRRGPQTQTMKFKKAEPLIRNEGWVLVEPVQK
ncbi:preprotein translocase subunit SecA [Cerasicoccus arenae]|uniref:Protein translocase subunit SecA n=1 Tax=Cerasicoccus arenae TaxID=424488 RepID=A0A8J3GDB3_9BACT|nr:preprotein translocase subunit SecA [Cerasicoccus arenae]MBK1857509.1 preprotein translocase subunit SecA [Cerasicoccus arenae]GHB95430.1 protein translocase subunit SecA [Cerasicoccus arenae]